MIDSTMVSIKELYEIGQSFRYAKKIMAVQWFVANSSLLLSIIGGVAMYLLYKYIPVSGAKDNSKIKVTTKKLLIYVLIFIAGLISSQYALQIWGIILWIASFSVGVLMHLKWNKWFIKRDASVIPIGWIYTYSAFIIILIVLLNIIPSMVSVNEAVQSYFRN